MNEWWKKRVVSSRTHTVGLNQPHAPLASDHDGKHLLCLCVSLPFPLPALLSIPCVFPRTHWFMCPACPWLSIDTHLIHKHTHTHTHTSHTHPPCLSVHVCFKGWIQWGLTGIQIDLLSLKQLFFSSFHQSACVPYRFSSLPLSAKTETAHV